MDLNGLSVDPTISVVVGSAVKGTEIQGLRPHLGKGSGIFGCVVECSNSSRAIVSTSCSVVSGCYIACRHSCLPPLDYFDSGIGLIGVK